MTEQESAGRNRKKCTSGILTTWTGYGKSVCMLLNIVHTCLYLYIDSCTCMYMYIHVHTFIHMYIHVYTCTWINIFVCTMYIHVYECKYMYGHGTDMFVQIHNHTSHSITQFTCNCMYVFEHCMYIVHTCLDMVQTCFTQSTTFKQCCTSFRQCYGTGICILVHTVFRPVHTPQERLWQVVSFLEHFS